jgi:thiamine-phosphate pyrophosphorylase
MPGLRGYYAIIDVPGSSWPGADWLAERARQMLAARPCVLQLRAKGLSAAALFEAATLLRAACGRAGVPLCVNDRVDVALAAGADAVHVGQDDLPLGQVRRLVEAAAGPGRARPWIGVSTHDGAQARAARAGGADYIGFGPVFATTGKHDPGPVVGLVGLREVARAIDLPVVAIGGIDLDNVVGVAAAGAAAAAVISAVGGAKDPTAAGLRVGAAFAGTGIEAGAA